MQARSIIVGVVGQSGSGKTSIAAEICRILGKDAVLVMGDHYYVETTDPSIDWDDPSACDSNLLRSHILALKEGKSIEQPIFDFKTSTRLPEKKITPSARVIIVESLFLFAIPEIKELLDIKIFIKTPSFNALGNRLMRDMMHRIKSDNDDNKTSADHLRFFRAQLEKQILIFTTRVRKGYEKNIKPFKNEADLIIENPYSTNKQLPDLCNVIEAIYNKLGHPRARL